MSSVPESPPASPLRRLGPGLAGVLSLLVFCSLLVVPLLGVLLAVLAPLPLLHLRGTGRPSILGWGWVAAALAGAALLTREPGLIILLVGYLTLAAWPAWSVELRLRWGWSAGRWVAMVGVVALALIALPIMAAAYPAAPGDRLVEMLQAATSGNEQLIAALGGGGWSARQAVAEALRSIAYLAPALLAIYAVVCALWLRPRLPALGLVREIMPFAKFASEEWLPIGFIVGGVGWVFATGALKWLSANLLVVVGGLYFIHGLAIIHFHLGPRLAANRWVRLAVALIAVQMPLNVVVAVLGLTDSFYSLRRGSAFEGGSEA